jgi:NAD-dependent dihydropyrimidine dehydrogenase PreA subunit
MRELRIHGRGGQGAVIASKVLAVALFREGAAGAVVPRVRRGAARRAGDGVPARGRRADPAALRGHGAGRPDRPRSDTDRRLDVTAGLKPGGGILINSAARRRATEAASASRRDGRCQRHRRGARHRLAHAAHREHGDPRRLRGRGPGSCRWTRCATPSARRCLRARRERAAAREAAGRGARRHARVAEVVPWLMRRCRRPPHLGEPHEHAGEPHRLVEVHPAALPRRRGAVQRTLSDGCRRRGLHEPAAAGPIDEAMDLLLRENPMPAVTGRVCHHPCETGVQPRALRRARWRCTSWSASWATACWPRRSAVAAHAPSASPWSASGRRAWRARTTWRARLPRHGIRAKRARPAACCGRASRRTACRATCWIADRLVPRAGIDILCTCTRRRRTHRASCCSESSTRVFIRTGAHRGRRSARPARSGPGVLPGLEFLKAVNRGERPDIGRACRGVGGGNTAMDCARTALRLGARSRWCTAARAQEMPAIAEEIEEAEREGVASSSSRTRARSSARGRLVGVECERMELGEPDASGRRRPSCRTRRLQHARRHGADRHRRGRRAGRGCRSMPMRRQHRRRRAGAARALPGSGPAATRPASSARCPTRWARARPPPSASTACSAQRARRAGCRRRTSASCGGAAATSACRAGAATIRCGAPARERRQSVSSALNTATSHPCRAHAERGRRRPARGRLRGGQPRPRTGRTRPSRRRALLQLRRLQRVRAVPDLLSRRRDRARAGRRLHIDLDHCKGCGVCAMECPRGAIVMTREGL